MARTKEFVESEVLNKAMLTFWEQGYEKTSMQDLVNQMGIHRRSIYDTFGDKHTLFMMTLERYEHDLERDISSRIKKEMPIQEKLRTLFSIVLTNSEKFPRGCLIVNSATELALQDEEVSKKIKDSFSKSEQFIYQLLVDAQVSEDSLRGRNLEDLASYLNNAWVGLRVLAKTTDDIQKLNTIIDVTLSIL